MHTTIRAKSSSGGSYDVIFSIENGRLKVKCNCKAGSINQQCKHKIGLVSGTSEMLFDQNELGALRQLCDSKECRELAEVLAVKEAALLDVERLKREIAAKEKAIKNEIGVLFSRGILD